MEQVVPTLAEQLGVCVNIAGGQMNGFVSTYYDPSTKCLAT